MKTVLIGRTSEELAQITRGLNLQAYRTDQLMDWMYRQRVDDFEQMTNLPLDLRSQLDERFRVCDMKVLQHRTGEEGTEKFAFTLRDGEVVETVIMRYEHGVSLCLSTQVGCVMGCPFCATGAGGLLRNLSRPEILGQWFLAQRRLDETGERISHVVMMGMGEPLNNYEHSHKSLRLLHSEEGPGISYRRMTLSTVGITPRILQLAEEDMPITLAVSLHAPNDYLRDRLVPVNKKHPLSELIPACELYAEHSGRRVSFEYAMMKGVNDHPELARELGVLLRDMTCHINLIPFNPVPGVDYEPSPLEAVRKFRDVLSMVGLSVTIRRPLGLEIDAACGQLRRHLGAEDAVT